MCISVEQAADATSAVVVMRLVHVLLVLLLRSPFTQPHRDAFIGATEARTEGGVTICITDWLCEPHAIPGMPTWEVPGGTSIRAQSNSGSTCHTCSFAAAQPTAISTRICTPAGQPHVL